MEGPTFRLREASADRRSLGGGGQVGPRGADLKISACSRTWKFQPILLHPVSDLIAVQAEEGGGAGLVAVGALEGQHDEVALEIVEAKAVGRK
jgi:hypothetical protein